MGYVFGCRGLPDGLMVSGLGLALSCISLKPRHSGIATAFELASIVKKSQ